MAHFRVMTEETVNERSAYRNFETSSLMDFINYVKTATEFYEMHVKHTNTYVFLHITIGREAYTIEITKDGIEES